MSAADSERDRRFMRLALALGGRNLGLTWPNPSVGAVVVRDGPEPMIVGQGATQAGGRPHAERVALAMAGEAARGATLYVTLEPCSHHGRTPPCVDAIVESGVARVVSALEDPDPRVAGRGYGLLRAAGIAVAEGVEAEAAARAHRGHVLRVTEGRPLVTLKLARTADGFAARLGRERLLITGEAANARVHLMRAHHDAILVGIGTALADDPLLTVRLPGLERRSPVRVVLDPGLRLPPVARLVATARDVPTWVVAGEDASSAREAALAEAGARVFRVGLRERGSSRLETPPGERPDDMPQTLARNGSPPTRSPHPEVPRSGLEGPPGAERVLELSFEAHLRLAPQDEVIGWDHHSYAGPAPREAKEAGASLALRAALQRLAEEGITRLFVEGGPRTADALAAAGLIDEVVLLTAPARLDGPGVPALGPNLSRALSRDFRLAEEGRLGQDRLERFERMG